MLNLVHILLAMNASNGTLDNPKILSIDLNGVNTPIGQCGLRLGFTAKQSGWHGNAAPYELPWTISVHDMKGRYLYAAVLIHPNVVLGCAHLVNNSLPYRLRAGLISQYAMPGTFQERIIAERVIHPDFGSTYYTGEIHDVSLMFVKVAFTLSYQVNTICLPEPHESILKVPYCVESSWGMHRNGQFSANMKRMYMDPISKRACLEKFRSTALGPNFQLHHSMMCAENLEGVDGCQGDSGGPLACPITNDEGRYQLVGVQSQFVLRSQDNPSCSYKYMPIIFSIVAKNMKWINQEMDTRRMDQSFYTKPPNVVKSKGGCTYECPSSMLVRY